MLRDNATDAVMDPPSPPLSPPPFAPVDEHVEALPQRDGFQDLGYLHALSLL